MSQISRRGLWCCIVNSTGAVNVKTKDRLLVVTLADSRGNSVAKYAKLKDSDSEVRRTSFVRCVKVRIVEEP